mmetsp:Transcript_8437/g.22217  ORF Transcript_8437/g.22217 Transcript_8437/m.22217 type:complete len:93 (+) Transcript_8437:946-1224(+)
MLLLLLVLLLLRLQSRRSGVDAVSGGGLDGIIEQTKRSDWVCLAVLWRAPGDDVFRKRLRCNVCAWCAVGSGTMCAVAARIVKEGGGGGGGA